MKSHNLSWRNLPNLAHLLINSWHFGYKWPPKVTPSFQTIPKGITQPLNGNMAISGPFLTNSHQFWLKWYSNDIVSSYQPQWNYTTSHEGIGHILPIYWLIIVLCAQLTTKSNPMVPNSLKKNNIATLTKENNIFKSRGRDAWRILEAK